MNSQVKCPHCGKEYSSKGIATHIWRSHGEGKCHNPNIGYQDGTRQVWNKGLTKETSEAVKKFATTLSERIKSGALTPSWKGKHHSPESIKKMKQNSGGYRRGSGRGKSGWYKGYWCDSTWELAYVIYNIEHNIGFIRNHDKFEYEFNGEKHQYTPDFMLDDGTYVEIKGYETEQDRAKYSNFGYNIKLYTKIEMKPIFVYVYSKYGKDLAKLYMGG